MNAPSALLSHSFSGPTDRGITRRRARAYNFRRQNLLEHSSASNESEQILPPRHSCSWTAAAVKPTVSSDNQSRQQLRICTTQQRTGQPQIHAAFLNPSQRDKEEDQLYSSTSKYEPKTNPQSLSPILHQRLKYICILVLVACLPTLVVSENVGCPREVLESTHGHHIHI